jgi:O-acetyl-ADP-ribose deacetylase (regulator of RNase III)
LGIAGETSFPSDVRSGITQTLDAKAHVYRDNVVVIHVVGPNLTASALMDEAQAVVQLQEAYANVFEEFDQSGATTLRLLPISGGIYAGRFRSAMPQITIRAYAAGFGSLPEGVRSSLLTKFETHKAELCIFEQSEYAAFHSELEEHAVAHLTIK